jgi:hypothetical protein
LIHIFHACQDHALYDVDHELFCNKLIMIFTMSDCVLLQDTDMVRGEAAVRGVAGAAAVQGSILNLREVRQGADQEARGEAAPAPRPRPRP